MFSVTFHNLFIPNTKAKLPEDAPTVKYVKNTRTILKSFVDWRQSAAVMQREAVTVMPSCSGGGNAVVA
jgi:hypothetical protein